MNKVPEPRSAGRPDKMPAAAGIEVGQWYWVKEDDASDEWLGCVMKVGSNFAELHSPHGDRGYHTARIHFENIYRELRPEKHAPVVIQERIAHYQAAISGHINKVREIMSALGMPNYLPAAARDSDEPGTALATLSHQPDIGRYKKALIRAKDKQLPKLFESIKEDGERLSQWMIAESMPLIAQQEGLENVIDSVKDRIFNISLYAGLTERIKQVADGKPAAIDTKLHIMQRRLYMDEECLLNYMHGGMDFRRIDDFDDWISQPENRDRILPFPRCIVAMRVRRNRKDREWDGSLLSIFINLRFDQEDKLTFLYIRNGEHIYRLNTDLDFGELIFPDKAMFDPGEPMMVRIFGESVDQMITVSEYEEDLRVYQERKKMAKQWERDNPKSVWKKSHPREDWNFSNPYRDNHSFRPDEWEPFDSSNLYYDECVETIAERVKQYNRIALIIQGLFDRSEVLHPHPPVQTWTPEGFAAAIELVYDGSMILTHGKVPDFKAYMMRCNATIHADSVVIGQRDYWRRAEARKENSRRNRDYRNRTHHRVTYFEPYGNPGPNVIAKMNEWKPRARRAVFRWHRSTRRSDEVETSISVPATALFNVSAYKPGDYKQFFRDPRTREKYLNWAPMLLAAEDYHAGKWKEQKRRE